ncbi:MAG: hypothetical protein EA398_13830 [Deltaproteobacteria bacterium]|nr:MAG: hypothetical protein EA398_13830 [Deltaproteobacteria bacterium]
MLSDLITARRAAGATAALAALLATACFNVEGPDAPLDEFAFPQGLAVHPDGQFLYVVSTNFDGRYRDRVGGTLHVVDADNLALRPDDSARIASFSGTPVLMPTRDGDRLLLPARGDRSLHVLQVSDSGGAVHCRGQNDTRECRVPNLPANPTAVLPLPSADDGQQLVAVASMSGRVSFVRLLDGRVESAEVASVRVSDGTNILALHPVLDTLYAGGRFDWGLYGLEWVTGDDGVAEVIVTTRRIPIGVDTTGRGVRIAELRDIAFSSDGRRAYLSASSPSGVFVLDTSIDPDTGLPRDRYIERLDVDGRPGDLVVLRENDQDFLYVSASERDEIVVLHAGSGRIVDRIPTGRRPWGLAADTVRHGRLYVSLFEDNAIDVIDIDPGSPTWRTVVDTIR